ncbi:TetR/AcrR family transcriptional regulator [Streptomyces orinoci]|uniref:TetR/AcrR family transcriptional regulator n=1 Tax=Streptomyces orinoci TaxID=67339 RepID=A0ABV3K734_STRON|nr:TetR/AcrR family transcriptional regulator [Streptomyces orinoci]
MTGKHGEIKRLLWGPHAAPARGPRRTLDLDRIARAGIELADAEGLAALSMQRLAERLGVTKMALYRYVPGKTELVALLVDAAIGPYPPEAGGEDWRTALEDWAVRLLAVFRRHPWALGATVGPRLPGPAELSWLEAVVAALDGTGLGGAERMDAAVLLTGHVRMISEQSPAAGPSPGVEEQLTAAIGEVLTEHGDRFPALTAALATGPEGRENAWEFGLRRILDGLAALIAERTGR